MASSKREPLIDKLERLVFGASAQERVDMMIELAYRRMEARLVAALTSDDASDTTSDGETPDNGEG